MTLHDDTPEIDDEWQFEELAVGAPTQGGGGLLRQILDEVTSLRDGTTADRGALADALAASFSKIDVELEVLREQVAALRSELDTSGTVVTNALTELFKAVDADTEVDVAAVVEQLVAAQGQANVDAVVAALAPELVALREAVPTADTARIAMEVSRLRHSLIGPDPTSRG
jgi:succinyl-CoA synthetase alpha subunit